MSPDEYCQQKTAQSGSSFYYSFLFLPPERRRAITALYAFCREVDDTVDEASDQSVARIKLAWWRENLERLDREQAPAEPRLQAAAQELLPRGVSGTALCRFDGLRNTGNVDRNTDSGSR